MLALRVVANHGDNNAFEEAERALAEVEGRDPEVVRKSRLLREMDAKDAERRQKEQARASHRRMIATLTRLTLASAALVAGTLAFRIWQDRSKQNNEAERLLAPHAAALVSAGFQREVLAPFRKGKIALNAPLEGCFAAVGASAEGAAQVELVAGGKRAQGQGFAIGCGCSRGEVSASTESASGQAALALYRASSEAVGGLRGLRRALPSATVIDLSAPCAEAELDLWLSRRGQALARAASGEASGPEVEALASRGLRVTGHSPRGDDLVPFSIGPDECGLVLAARPSLRGSQGAIWAEGAEAGVAFCGAPAGVNAVIPRAPGPVLVATARLADVGGVLPLIDAARSAGVKGAIKTVLAPSTAATSARRLLERVVGQGTQATSLPAAAEVRLLSVARSQTAKAASVGPLLCDPPLDEGVPQAMCLLPPGKALAGLTEELSAYWAPSPVWLRALERAAAAPAAQAKMLSLLSLARSLRAEGFEPLTLESSRELPGAAEVTGRAGEGRVVVVDLSPRPPYAVPLSDGPRWALGGPPRVIPLSPGEKRLLRDPLLAASPASERRTVVFRAAPLPSR